MNLDDKIAHLRSSDTLSDFDAQAVETVAALLDRVRQAQDVVAKEGIIASKESGEPIEHPAVKVERAASAEIRGWVKERPDLFGEKRGGSHNVRKFRPTSVA